MNTHDIIMEYLLAGDWKVILRSDDEGYEKYYITCGSTKCKDCKLLPHDCAQSQEFFIDMVLSTRQHPEWFI